MCIVQCQSVINIPPLSQVESGQSLVIRIIVTLMNGLPSLFLSHPPLPPLPQLLRPMHDLCQQVAV